MEMETVIQQLEHVFVTVHLKTLIVVVSIPKIYLC
jgi:hypothetical protein